jgi:RNA polymerase sigma-70 factor (sigma-E family)
VIEDDAVVMNSADLNSFAEAHGRSLMRLAFVLTGDPDRSQDLVQTVMTKMLDRDTSRVDNMLAYARRALVNEHASAHRAGERYRRLLQRLEPAAAVQAPEAQLTDRAAILHALHQLNERQRTAIVLRYLEDLDDSETADILDCSPATVRSLVARALSKLRQALSF